MVRLLMKDDNAPSVEGFFTGFWAGHYVIRVPKTITLVAGETATDSLDCVDLTVPRENVFAMQRLA